MPTTLLALLLISAPALEPGTQLAYTGTMAPAKDDGDPAIKKFELRWLALGEGELAWTLQETGRGGFLALDHVGQLSAETDSGPALLFERPTGKGVVPILPPWLAGDVPLSEGKTWEEGGLKHKVAGEAMRGDRRCWEIEVNSPYGRKRTLWVDRGSPVIVAMHETVFLGQGDEHQLTLELTSVTELSPEEREASAAAVAAWQGLRQTLSWSGRRMESQLNDAEIAALKAALPKLKTAQATFTQAVADEAERDSAGQKNRANAVAALREAALKQKIGPLGLSDLAGKPLAADALAGKVVVLHFWEYRDAPLEEPYGQVGYLDHLARQRSGDGVVVYGVHTDPKLADDETRRESINSARKLQAFMNLSFPILLDDGALLKRLGDPRQGGGELPLFLVASRDGRLVEYRAGLYPAKANEGLRDLNAAIDKALESK